MPDLDTGVPHIARIYDYQRVTFRTRDEVAGLAAGLDLVDPGVVPVQEWRPDSALDTGSAPTAMWGFVARKP